MERTPLLISSTSRYLMTLVIYSILLLVVDPNPKFPRMSLSILFEAEDTTSIKF